MSNHICKDTSNLIKLLVTQGCRVKDQGQKFMIYAPCGKEMLTVHVGKRSFHPVRRWALNQGFRIK